MQILSFWHRLFQRQSSSCPIHFSGRSRKRLAWSRFIASVGR